MVNTFALLTRLCSPLFGTRTLSLEQPLFWNLWLFGLSLWILWPTKILSLELSLKMLRLWSNKKCTILLWGCPLFRTYLQSYSTMPLITTSLRVLKSFSQCSRTKMCFKINHSKSIPVLSLQNIYFKIMIPSNHYKII